MAREQGYDSDSIQEWQNPTEGPGHDRHEDDRYMAHMGRIREILDLKGSPYDRGEISQLTVWLRGYIEEYKNNPAGSQIETELKNMESSLHKLETLLFQTTRTDVAKKQNSGLAKLRDWIAKINP